MGARAVLRGCGATVAPIEVSNDMLARVMDTSDEWIQERTGIRTRFYVEPGTGSSALGAEAARQALEDADLDPQSIDYLVCATMTPDHYFPGSGTMVQELLGLPPIPALDIRQQCAGFAYGMQMVDALIRSGVARNVLLVGCDVHSALIPFSPRTWEVLFSSGDSRLDASDYEFNTRFRHLIPLFGDAAGAMVFQAEAGSGERGILGSELHGDGGRRDILYVPGVGSAHRPFVDAEMIEQAESVPVMDGRQVFKLAVTRMPKVTKSVLAAHGYGLDDLDLLVMHQANLRINEAAQRALRLDDEKVHHNIQRFGNTTSATLPLCFHEARQVGKAPAGSLVAFTALGAGLHWGSVLMRV